MSEKAHSGNAPRYFSCHLCGRPTRSPHAKCESCESLTRGAVSFAFVVRDSHVVSPLIWRDTANMYSRLGAAREFVVIDDIADLHSGAAALFLCDPQEVITRHVSR